MNYSVTFALLSLSCSFGIALVSCAPSPPTNNATSTAAASPNATATAAPGTPTSSPHSVAPNSPTPAVGISPSPSPQAAARPPLTVEKLKNAEYFFLAKGPIKLVNGKYEDPVTKRTYTMSDVVAYGDINKDGIKDAVTVLKVTIPNTGDFSYLVAAVNEDGNPKNVSSEFIGPGIVPKTLKVNADNSIEAVMDQYQAGDPACCPSLKITRTYKLKLNQTPSPAPAQPKN